MRRTGRRAAQAGPTPQVGQRRGSLPSSLSGNSQGARKSSSAAVISEGFCSITSSVFGLKSRQKLSSTACQLGAPARNLVELVLEPGGEIVGDVAFEEALEEGGQQPAAFLGIEAVLLDPDIVAVLQRLQRRGVGRGPADAELLHPLDQARLGITRRRLGEMLLGLDLLLRRRIAFAAAAAGGGCPRPRHRRGLLRKARGSRGRARPGRSRARRGGRSRRSARRWCARAWPRPSGSPARASRSARRAGHDRPIRRGRGRNRSAGSPRALPAHSWPWSRRCAACPAHSRRRSGRRPRARAAEIALRRHLHAVGAHIGDRRHPRRDPAPRASSGSPRSRACAPLPAAGSRW